MPKHGKAKKDGVINPQIKISVNLNTENLFAFKTLRLNGIWCWTF